MTAAGIVARRHRRRRGLTKRDETAAPLPDLVGRLFDPDRLDHTWAGDVTCVPTDEGWLYLATVLDLGSRRLLGYSMSQAADTDHVINAVAMAVAARGRTTMAGTIFHSDRGSTYTSARYRQTCTDLGLRQSAGRTGSCLDNAVVESFFATLKQELGRVTSPPAPTRAGRSLPGSTTTTSTGCTPPAATARQPSTNSS